MSACVLKTEDLSIGYGSKCVAEGISLQLEEGRILCLIGPNGSGKSTLLKTLMRQIPPLKGSIFLGDRKLERIPEKELARFSAAVLTGRPTPELMTCGELVAMGRYPYTGRLGILSEEDRAVVRSSMEMTETAFLRDEDFTRISDGQRQRVLLARAICQQPKLLLLDEPTSFLDIRHKLEFHRCGPVPARAGPGKENPRPHPVPEERACGPGGNPGRNLPGRLHPQAL